MIRSVHSVRTHLRQVYLKAASMLKIMNNEHDEVPIQFYEVNNEDMSVFEHPYIHTRDLEDLLRVMTHPSTSANQKLLQPPAFILVQGSLTLCTLGPILRELSSCPVDFFVLDDICCLQKLLEVAQRIVRRQNRRTQTILFILNYHKYFSNPLPVWRRVLDKTVSFGVTGPLRKILQMATPFSDVKVLVSFQKGFLNSVLLPNNDIQDLFHKVVRLKRPDKVSRLNAFKNLMEKPFRSKLNLERELGTTITIVGVIGIHQSLTHADLDELVRLTEGWEIKGVEDIFHMIHTAYLNRHLPMLINLRILWTNMYRFRPVDTNTFYDMVYVVNLQRRIERLFSHVADRARLMPSV